MVVPLALMLTAACAAPSGAEPAPVPTATLPLPGPDSNTPAEDSDSPASEPDEASEMRLDGMTVVVDPGHNGANHTAPEVINRQVDAVTIEKNCDTVGAETEDGYAEHEFNFDLSVRVQERLEDSGATVILTREDNDSVGPCITERAGIANEAGADVAISIHADGGPPTGRGFHIIAPAEIPDYTEEIVEPSLRLAEDIRDHFQEESGQPYTDYIAADEGIHVRDDLGGLNLSAVPKVFLEAGNMRNTEDAALLSDEQWRDEAADGVAAGLTAFLLRE